MNFSFWLIRNKHSKNSSGWRRFQISWIWYIPVPLLIYGGLKNFTTPYKFTIVPSLRWFRGVYTYFGATDWKGMIQWGNRRKSYSNTHTEFCLLTSLILRHTYFISQKKFIYFFVSYSLQTQKAHDLISFCACIFLKPTS